MAEEPPGGGKPAPCDRDVEVYKALRGHEVMLNQAASAFEHAVTTRLVTLNGGAAAAFLTLLGAISKSADRLPYQPWFAGGAVLVWSAGLMIASLAAWCGLKRQQALNQAFRIMREQVEQSLSLSDTLAEIVIVPPNKGEKGKSESERRELLREVARRFENWFNRAFPASAVCFGIGAVCALLAILVH